MLSGLSLPRTWFLLEPLPLQPTMSNLLSDVRLHLPVVTLRDGARLRASLQLEILALRHQLHVLELLHGRRVRLTRLDRLLWVWFFRVWCHWRTALVIVKPETVIAWPGAGSVFSGRGRAVIGQVGRPPLKRSAP